MYDHASPRSRRTGASALVLLMGATLLLGPTTTLAQDEQSSAPVASDAAGAEQDSAELADLMPGVLSGTPVIAGNITIFEGQQILEVNPGIEPLLTEIMAATGAGIDDIVQGAALVRFDGAETFVGAFQVKGADPTIVMEVVMSGARERSDSIRTEPGEIADKAVVIGTDDALPDAGPSYFYAYGDVLWTVRGSDAHVAEALEQLPG